MTNPWRRPLLPAATLVSVALLACVATPAVGQFRVREPELAFKGLTTRLEPGVHVVSTAEELDALRESIEPVPEALDLEGVKLMVVVGDDRADDCRVTILEEVGTRLRTALITLVERRPGPTCRCAAQEPVRSVFGVLVAGLIGKAKLESIDVAVDCGAAGRRPEGTTAAVEEILSGTLVDATPGARLVGDAEGWLAVCSQLNQSETCPAVDFERSKVAVVVGAPLDSSCRRTASDGITIEGPAARVALREIHPGPDRMCSQVFGGYQVFVYRVPAGVETVEVASRRVQ